KPFGKRAIERGYATEGEVLQALRAQYSAKVVLGRHLFLGEVLLLQGVLTPRQLTELLRESGEFHEEAEDVVEKRFFGDVAIELGFVKPRDVLEGLNDQMDDDMLGRRHRLLGEILYAKGLLTDAQVDAVIARLHARA
ncbi:MAG TPA: hypothetical protein VHF22_06935, partial [Planctomycetota bacterium]|nr:hypothetical protein [Planctomycetota bacterium]